ncbi:heme oxygenase-like protein [Stipitochalara longipes BDJ]|nr:heme oxygenase-like protein [Stipitochalara longipes BDJ]
MANLELPTPSPKGHSFDASPSLSERINIATRSVHSQLNRLILVRLPLALPPYTSSPSTYATGLLHVAPIYITFESLWQAILDLSYLPTTSSHSAGVGSGQKAFSRKRSLLSHLYITGLPRAQRLRADIKDLTGMSDSDIEDHLDTSSRNGRLAEFVAHTRKAVDSNPHVLLAYAWVFYMALFSGGRYLRAALAEAGGEGTNFWTTRRSLASPGIEDATQFRRCTTSESEEHIGGQSSTRSRYPLEKGDVALIPGLQFFNFAGDVDGEDIKLEFKKRIAEAEILLTCGEKEHIIAEAEHIFKFMVEIVLELDKIVSPCTTGTLSLHEVGLLYSQNSRMDIRKEIVERKTPTITHSKRGSASCPSGDIIHARYMSSTCTKWLTSLVPMVICIVLTSWYYGM